jgi:hypothetical protein
MWFESIAQLHDGLRLPSQHFNLPLHNHKHLDGENSILDFLFVPVVEGSANMPQASQERSQ